MLGSSFPDMNLHKNRKISLPIKHQESFIKWEGTKGAIKTTLGTNINYPNGGVPDSFEYVMLEEDKEPEWKSATFDAAWFPDAFIGSMANVLCRRLL